MANFLRPCLALLLAASAAAGNAAAPGGDEAAVQDVRKRLADGDDRGAAIAVNTLIVSRLPAKLPARPDPVLDRVYTELLLRTGDPRLTTIFAARAATEAPVAERAHYRLILAVAQEAGGDFAGAEREYRALMADPGVGIDAVLGLARVQMISDPRAALATLDAMTNMTREREWERALLSARAADMSGDARRAEQASDTAWSAAPRAPAADAAIARIATDRALRAGRAGDRAGLVALLSVDRLDRDSFAGRALSDALPICGENGLRPDDQVMVEISRAPSGNRPRVDLVWSSRPGIAAPFLRALYAFGATTMPVSGQVAPLALRCRQRPSDDYPALPNFAGLYVDWLSQQGVFPLMDIGENEGLSLAGELSDRERRYGPKSLALVAPLTTLFATTMIEGTNNPEARTRSVAIAERIVAILQGGSAPADLLLTMRFSLLSAKLTANQMTVEAAQAAFKDLFEQAAREQAISPDLLYFVTIGTAKNDAAPTAIKEAVLTRALDVLRARAAIGDPRTLSLAMRLIALKQRANDRNAAASLAGQYGLSSDLCAMADNVPTFVSSEIRSEDYPPDLLRTLMRGTTGLEFALDPTGAARDRRILVSDPPFAFDRIASEKSATIRYNPASRGAVPVGCTGITQTVRWQMPY
ncbi:hypothetical protein [Sphingomonas profundi]|uniref:hypothetical protein n=1 Tax=Alterirhizorhabdus profundi TaxID=2681549 RepID=UPI0012E92FD2|nr:hypothetical protein [Sphingomonas profundi]